MKRTAIVALTMLCCTVGHTKEFNVELRGALNGDDFGAVFDADVYALDARYYFHAVSDSDGPYREASFIHPASSIAVIYTGAESEQKDIEADSDNWQVQGRYQNRTHGWYLSAGLGQGESETRAIPSTDVFGFFGGLGGSLVPFELPVITLETDIDSKNYELGFGHYFGARTTLDLSYTRTETDADTQSTDCFDTWIFGVFTAASGPLQCLRSGLVTRSETETDRLQLTVKHLRNVARVPVAFRGTIGYLKSSTETEPGFSDTPLAELAIPVMLNPDIIFDPTMLDQIFSAAIEFPQPTSFSDEGWNTAVDVTLYPRRNLGLTVAYDYADIEDNQTKTYGVALEWFITRSFAVSLSYTDIDFDNNFGSSDSVALRLNGRF